MHIFRLIFSKVQCQMKRYSNSIWKTQIMKSVFVFDVEIAHSMLILTINDRIFCTSKKIRCRNQLAPSQTFNFCIAPKLVYVHSSELMMKLNRLFETRSVIKSFGQAKL
ncbi:hypothetical protein T08_1544 [Trichinella sp. T8]|nr:hypothetical protein T08_1544 [Trichinella sp. T8]